MACLHPIAAWERIGKVSPNGKKIITFGQIREPEKWKPVDIPCGQCIECRLQYSRQWANRIMLEAKEHESNWFLTLTYAPEHLPYQQKINLETGELIEGNPLIPEHFKKFMKDLRRYWQYHYGHDNIRFYGCGEYGSLSERPHYHICIFNLPIKEEDLVFMFNNHQGDAVYTSPVIEKIWGKGIISLGAVTWESAAYVARYMLKKQKGDNAKWYYESKGQTPEFTRMSRKPGIGMNYFLDNMDKIYQNDEIIIPTKKGSKAIKPPRYYDQLFDICEPEQMQLIKEKRAAAAERAEAVAEAQTTLWPWERREIRERTLKEAVKKLPRPVE